MALSVQNFSEDQSADLLDLLFNPGDGIITCGPGDYDFNSTIGFSQHGFDYENKQQELQFTESNFNIANDALTDEIDSNFVDCLKDIDLLASDLFTYDSQGVFDQLPDVKPSKPHTNPSSEDHQYCLSPEQEKLTSNSPSFYTDGSNSPSEQVIQPWESPNYCSTETADSPQYDAQLSSESGGDMAGEGYVPVVGGEAEVGMGDYVYEQGTTFYSTCDTSNVNTLVESLCAGVLDHGALPEQVTSSGQINLDMDTDMGESGSDEGGSCGSAVTSYTSQRSGRRQVSISSLPFTHNDILDDSPGGANNTGCLELSEEEKILLAKEGVSLPTHLPLTREEEKALKTVRRKIRNKVSAKTSRKKKQEYVDGLERRVKVCSANNKTLQDRVTKLEKQNMSLLDQLKKIRALLPLTVGPANNNLPVIAQQNQQQRGNMSTGTCIMVLVLSFSLFIVPNINPFFSQNQPSSEPNISPGSSRRLLEHDPGSDPSLFSEPPKVSVGQDSYVDTRPQPPYPFTKPISQDFTSAEITGKSLPADENSYQSEVIKELDQSGSSLESVVEPVVVTDGDGEISANSSVVVEEGGVLVGWGEDKAPGGRESIELGEFAFRVESAGEEVKQSIKNDL